MNRRPSRDLALSLAHILSNALGRSKLRALPPGRVLADTYGVSPGTVRAALAMLGNQGILSGSKSPQSTERSSGSAQTLFDRISSQILNGHFEAGTAFPKIAVLANTYRASSVTLCRVLVRLEKENLVHKQGKRWIAGPRRLSDTYPSGRNGPAVVLVIVPDAQWWYSLNQDLPLSSFAQAFHREIDSAGIRPLVAFVDPPQNHDPSLIVGRESVEKIIRRVGNRFMGSVLYSHPDRLVDLDRWLVMLSATGRPAVYLDATDQGAAFNRRALQTGPHLYRCHFDERGAVEAAVNAICRAGHRVAAIPVYESPAFSWIRRRASLLAAEARRQSVAVVSVKHGESCWEFERWDSIGSFAGAFERLSREGSSGAVLRKRQARDIARDITPGLVQLLEERAPSVWIAPNDRFAREYYLWLRYLGLRVPEDISLISFDNQLNARFFPLSSIDLGFHSLGYKAAHVLIGDMHIPADRLGNIAGPCRLVDRGSLAQPGAG